jgi:hypothetical protein
VENDGDGCLARTRCRGRLVLLWLATIAGRQRSPVILFDNAADVSVELGMSTNGSPYRQLSSPVNREFKRTRGSGDSGGVWLMKVYTLAAIWPRVGTGAITGLG